MVVHHKRAPYDVYIGRPSAWGNPFSHLPASAAEWRVATRDEAIRKYEEWLLAQPELVERVRRELRGKVLGCWCRPSDGFRGQLLCHGQILAGLANDINPRSIE